MIKVGNKRIEKWSKMERFLVPKQMGRFLGNSPTVRVCSLLHCGQLLGKG